MQIDTVFRPLIRLERAIAVRWAEVFEEDREAAFVWFKMANEEKGHAGLADYRRRVVQKNPNLSGEVDVDLEDVTKAIDMVRRSLDGPSPTLDDAVRLAYLLETSAAESHFRNALNESHPELRRPLECLGGEDRQHLERLKGFAANRNIPLQPSQEA